VAQADGAQLYYSELKKFRTSQGGSPHIGPNAKLFGQQVTGLTSLIDLSNETGITGPVIVTEWVVEAGNRLWIVRSSQEVTNENDASSEQREKSANNDYQIDLTGMNLDVPSASLVAQERHSPGFDGLGSQSTNGDLPFPSWWNGDCDTNHYRAVAKRDAYPAGPIAPVAPVAPFDPSFPATPDPPGTSGRRPRITSRNSRRRSWHVSRRPPSRQGAHWRPQRSVTLMRI